MILCGWAKLIDHPTLYKEDKVHCVEIALGKNKNGERTKYFVISKEGSMFDTIQLGRYEIHKLHDTQVKCCDTRKWLINNLESESLHKYINAEKSAYLTMYQHADSCKRTALIKFQNSDYNYTVGIKDFVTLDLLQDFFIFNEFDRGENNQKHECIDVEISTKFS
jgi:hypothetical protein